MNMPQSDEYAAIGFLRKILFSNFQEKNLMYFSSMCTFSELNKKQGFDSLC